MRTVTSTPQRRQSCFDTRVDVRQGVAIELPFSATRCIEGARSGEPASALRGKFGSGPMSRSHVAGPPLSRLSTPAPVSYTALSTRPLSHISGLVDSAVQQTEYILGSL